MNSQPAAISRAELSMLRSCQSNQDWSQACTTIKNARDGISYPQDWWARVISSGLADQVMARWGETSDLTIEEA
jgi:hypothetical protein